MNQCEQQTISMNRTHKFLITLLLTFCSHHTNAEESSITLINCPEGKKINCSDCTPIAEKQIKILTNQKHQTVLIREYKNSTLLKSYELKNCNIYNNQNWTCNYPRNSSDYYSEEMLYKVIDGYMEIKFSSSLGNVRMCGTK